jgi:hypothetical protein
MKNKVENISKMRNKKKRRSQEQAAEAAARTFLDKLPPGLQEPEAFASGGDMSKINQEIENEDN